MHAGPHATFYSLSRPSPEWHDFDYLRSAKSNRGMAISLLMALWIAVFDLCWPHTNLSVLFVAPVLLFAWTGNLKPLWRTAGTLVVLTYGIFF